jgi:hypothetical protein
MLLALLWIVDMDCTRLSAKNNDTFSFATFKGKSVVDYQSNVVSGVFTNSPYGPV